MHPVSFQTKAEARAWGLCLRDQIPPAELRAISAAATRRLVESCEYAQAETLLCYVGSKGSELDTKPLLQIALAARKQVLVPITRPGGAMYWSRLKRLSDLEFTPRGILEPYTDSIDLVAADGGLCVVPGVCFRSDGHRIGFGGGYYDRFLSHYEGDAVALAPEALFGVAFPVERHDRTVSVVFTEATTHLTSE
jgi:5-formyltetrahydrofolate cyclo-ligase